MKVLVTEQISAAGIELLKQEKSFEVDVRIGLSAPELVAAIVDADALIVRSKTKVNRALIDVGERLKVIGRAGSGVDNIDLEAATKHGVIVMNTAGGNSTSVAEHTIALLLSLARHIPQAGASMRKGKWEKSAFMGIELHGKTLGIVGLGRIGAEVARFAKTLKMHVLAYDPFVSTKVAEDIGVRLGPLDEILSQADFITLHTSLTDNTRRLVNAQTIAKMKNGVRLVNCARGELIHEDDLRQALTSGKIAAAALDVFAVEPPLDDRLTSLPNVIGTPHIGASTHEAQEKVGNEIAEQIRDFLKDGIVRNAVNFPSVSFEEYKTVGPYLQLAEKLGAFISQISEGRMNEIGIRYYGDLTEMNTGLISSAVVKGILNPILSERVTPVNAQAIARSRGITLIESRSNRERSFSNLISIKLRTHTGEEWVEGTVLHKNNLRLVSVDGIDIEAPLTGAMLFIRNNDQPGVIGHVGTVLGDQAINIANFALGRGEQAKDAIGVVNVDEIIPEPVMSQIRSLPAVEFAKIIVI
ncbi:MAG: phosphoglycerate dehydrogenase [Acidobacteria bacterium]|nr:phosphoglycerate dehydrogenase [Acidobacteriota bacterium]